MKDFRDSNHTLSIYAGDAFYARGWLIIRHDEVAFYPKWKETRADLLGEQPKHSQDQFRTSHPKLGYHGPISATSTRA